MKPMRERGVIIFSILLLVLAACGGGATEETSEPVEEVVAESLDSPAVTTAKAVKTGKGITDEPCPEAVGGIPTGANPAQGCIYLGLLNDYTGPFAAASVALETGQRAFWLYVNSTGGIGGYSVAISEGQDTAYNPQKHLEGYNAIRNDVAALAMSIGTPQTVFILDELDADNMVTAPMSWYSGWSYKSVDRGLVVEFGSAYCADGMNAADWIADNNPLPTPIGTIGIIAYQGDYGGDWAAGVREAAKKNGWKIAWEYIPPVTEFDVAQAAGLLVTQPVDAYFPALSPGLMAQVMGGAAQAGVTPIAMLAAPSFNDAFVAEGFALKGLFESGLVYNLAFVDPYEADTAGHAAMRATLGSFTDSASTFLVAGWSSQYHLKGVLEAAVKGGDLTRAGIRRAASNVNVESDGMMPTRELGQNRADTESSIGKPDGSIGSGVQLLASRYVGKTAKAYDWDAGPCS